MITRAILSILFDAEYNAGNRTLVIFLLSYYIFLLLVKITSDIFKFKKEVTYESN